jgi:polyphenol oxidase
LELTWLTPDWPVPPGVRALSTLRAGGVSEGAYRSLNLGAHVGDAPERVAENRRRLAAAAELPCEPSWLAQVHGVAVADLDARDSPATSAAAATATAATADAACTRRAGRICAILTADCLPVLFAEEAGQAIAAAHAGWRGLAAGVLEAAVAATGTAPSRLLAWLGPAIGPKHFEVGPEVREALLRGDPAAEGAFALNARGRHLADLPALARSRLARLGIERIYGGGECTFEHPDRYFSHRRDGQSGRQATLIWIESGPKPLTVELRGSSPT